MVRKISLDTPIWRIKYLPMNLDEICGRENVKSRLREIITQKNFSHLLFVGSEGIGKTMIAQLFAKELLGKYHDANLKILHANVPLTEEERAKARTGAYISTSKIGSIAGKRLTMPPFIQVKVKPFVQLKVMGAPFKILIVKNFETLGNNQQGFRRLMETYGSNCRMILITTKISGIIDPIISRCQLFLISQADRESFENLINHIAEKESLELDKNVIDILYEISNGKLSRAIDLLQLCSISGNIISLNDLYENFQKSQKTLVKSLLLMIFRGDFKKARDISRNILTSYKYSSQELFAELLVELNKLPISTYAHSKIINMIADADFRAIDGRDNDIQVSALISKLCVFSSNL